MLVCDRLNHLAAGVQADAPDQLLDHDNPLHRAPWCRPGSRPRTGGPRPRRIAVGMVEGILGVIGRLGILGRPGPALELFVPPFGMAHTVGGTAAHGGIPGRRCS